MFGKLLSLVGLGDDPETAEIKRRMKADAADPRARLVFGLLAVSNEVDPAYDIEQSTMAIREWYGIADHQELVDRVRFYLDGVPGTPPAYDVFRAAFLARAGQAAGLLAEQESWELAFAAARKAQASYRSWGEYGSGYLEGHLAYRQSQGDDPALLEERRQGIGSAIAELQRDVWPQTPFNTPV